MWLLYVNCVLLNMCVCFCGILLWGLSFVLSLVVFRVYFLRVGIGTISESMRVIYLFCSLNIGNGMIFYGKLMNDMDGVLIEM